MSQQSWFWIHHSNQWMDPPTNHGDCCQLCNTCLTSHKCTNSLLLNRRKLHPPTHHWELREEPSLTAGHNRRRLEDVTASLSNHLQKLSRPSVQYAAWYSETHTSRNVAVPTSASHAVNDSKLSTNPVRHVGKRTLNSILIRAWSAPWHNYMCCAHTAKMAVNGEGNWGTWSATWVKYSTLVSLDGVIAREQLFWPQLLLWYMWKGNECSWEPWLQLMDQSQCQHITLYMCSTHIGAIVLN